MSRHDKRGRLRRHLRGINVLVVEVMMAKGRGRKELLLLVFQVRDIVVASIVVLVLLKEKQENEKMFLNE